METWKRNLYVIWVAELVAIAGFAVVLPFLPYYVRELGITQLHQVELWSGVLFAVQAVTMAIFAPIWGSLADRFGRKLMVERAMFGGAVVLAAMGFAQNVQQLIVLRAIQGMLTGTIPAATTLVASSAPRERSGYALGLLQTAVWTGVSVGPLLGGVVADTWGYRTAFLLTGGLLFLAGLTVWRFVEEDFQPPTRDSAGPEKDVPQCADHRREPELFRIIDRHVPHENVRLPGRAQANAEKSDYRSHSERQWVEVSGIKLPQ